MLAHGDSFFQVRRDVHRHRPRLKGYTAVENLKSNETSNPFSQTEALTHLRVIWAVQQEFHSDEFFDKQDDVPYIPTAKPGKTLIEGNFVQSKKTYHSSLYMG